MAWDTKAAKYYMVGRNVFCRSYEWIYENFDQIFQFLRFKLASVPVTFFYKEYLSSYHIYSLLANKKLDTIVHYIKSHLYPLHTIVRQEWVYRVKSTIKPSIFSKALSKSLIFDSNHNILKSTNILERILLFRFSRWYTTIEKAFSNWWNKTNIEDT